MKHGDFTELAREYINRPNYSKLVLNSISRYINHDRKENFQIVEVGAGTGKLTKDLLELGFKNVFAVEPNDEMRKEGIEYTKNQSVTWFKGSGEETGMDSGIANWILMASSFHWTDPKKSLPEFSRVLKPGGFFTALWNPRFIESSELHSRIEKRIHELVPNINRVSSGSSKYTVGIEDTLISTGHFKDVIFMEAQHEISMTKERYMGAWRSVNDIRVQAGEEKWQEILAVIEDEIKDLDEVIVPYKTRAWTAQKV